MTTKKKKKISHRTDNSTEKKILPSSNTEPATEVEIPVTEQVAPPSENFVDLRSQPPTESAAAESGQPFFWLNAPKQSKWRQDFLKRMSRLDRPEDLTVKSPTPAIAASPAVSAIPDSHSAEIPSFVLKLVASNHTWAHHSWHKIEAVLTGWSNSSWLRTFILFFIFCCLLIIPVKAADLKTESASPPTEIQAVTRDGCRHLALAVTALNNLDPDQARAEFATARQNFISAQSVPPSVGWLAPITDFFSGPSLDDRAALAGEKIASSGLDLIARPLLPTPETTPSGYHIALDDSNTDPLVIPSLATTALADDRAAIATLHQTDQALRENNLVAQVLAEILGHSGPKRYLIIFQNPAIPRATGGSLDTLAILDTADGRVVKSDILDAPITDLDQYLTAYLSPPEPFRVTNSRWTLENSNWWPDFTVSARKIAWFYENSGGATVDGIIALDNSLPSQISASLEPTATNSKAPAQLFFQSLETIATHLNQTSTDPSSAAADLNFLRTLSTAAANHQWQTYFSDISTQLLAAQIGWDGSIHPSAESQDFLLLTNTGLTANQNPAVVTRVDLRGEIQTDRSIINTLALTLNPATGWNYLRVYVPSGALLISDYGFTPFDQKQFLISDTTLTADTDLVAPESSTYFTASNTKIYQESGRTVFANWVKNNPAAPATITLKYSLPFKFTSTYNLYWQKQAGAPLITLVGTLTDESGQVYATYASADTPANEVLGGTK